MNAITIAANHPTPVGEHVQEDEQAQALDLPDDPDHGGQEVDQHEPGDQADPEGSAVGRC